MKSKKTKKAESTATSKQGNSKREKQPPPAYTPNSAVNHVPLRSQSLKVKLNPAESTAPTLAYESPTASFLSTDDRANDSSGFHEMTAIVPCAESDADDENQEDIIDVVVKNTILGCPAPNATIGSGIMGTNNYPGSIEYVSPPGGWLHACLTVCTTSLDKVVKKIKRKGKNKIEGMSHYAKRMCTLYIDRRLHLKLFSCVLILKQIKCVYRFCYSCHTNNTKGCKTCHGITVEELQRFIEHTTGDLGIMVPLFTNYVAKGKGKCYKHSWILQCWCCSKLKYRSFLEAKNIQMKVPCSHMMPSTIEVFVKHIEAKKKGCIYHSALSLLLYTMEHKIEDDAISTVRDQVFLDEDIMRHIRGYFHEDVRPILTSMPDDDLVTISMMKSAMYTTALMRNNVIRRVKDGSSMGTKKKKLNDDNDIIQATLEYKKEFIACNKELVDLWLKIRERVLMSLYFRQISTSIFLADYIYKEYTTLVNKKLVNRKKAEHCQHRWRLAHEIQPIFQYPLSIAHGGLDHYKHILSNNTTGHLPTDLKWIEVYLIKQSAGTLDTLTEDNINDRYVQNKIPQGITHDDRNRLHKYEYLKDSLIRFWVKWIQYGIRPAQESHVFESQVHVFDTSHYELLCSHGVNLRSKTARKMDIFDKKMLIVAINRNNIHWFVAAITHPKLFGNTINKKNAEDALPCIIFLDSIQSLTTQEEYDEIGTNLVNWIMQEKQDRKLITRGSRKNNVDFHVLNVPQQDNIYDCALYFCYYTYALLKREPSIVVADVFTKKGSNRSISNRFQHSLSGHLFKPAPDTIVDVRNHLKKLILFLAIKHQALNRARHVKNSNSTDVVEIA